MGEFHSTLILLDRADRDTNARVAKFKNRAVVSVVFDTIDTQ